MPDNLLTKHQHDSTPLGRNTMPVAECDVHDATIGGKACKAIDVPILSCASIWLRVQKEAEAWIAPGGKLIADPVARNRRINQAYAQLWQADHRFQWAGLAAFASKQVGCGLLHAAENIRKSQEEIAATISRLDIMSSADGAAVSAMPSGIAGSSAYMFLQLALGNTALFLDIYPLHRFYMLRGLEHLKLCLAERSKIANFVLWPAGNRLRFGFSFNEISKAFSMIENKDIQGSVRVLAYHEQINILQPVIYDVPAMRLALDANQLSWATNFPTGVAAEIELTLSAECKTQSSSLNLWFSKSKTAKLYDKDQRMEFVYQAAARFDKLLQSADRRNIEASIATIGAHGGTE